MRKAMVSGLALVLVSIAAPAAFGSNYVVLYKQQSLPRDAESTVARAGGSVIYQYPQIGVVIAKSESASFRDNLLKDNRIENAAATDRFATRLPDMQAGAEGPPPGDLARRQPRRNRHSELRRSAPEPQSRCGVRALSASPTVHHRW